MAASVFIIEAPGKRKSMSNLLWQAGVRDVLVIATVGHIGTNPTGFKPLAIDTNYRETAYRLMPEKEHIARNIGEAAKNAKHVFIATDDDQEGDVIARDVIRFCLDDEDRNKVLRMRLKAMAPSEIKSAMESALPFDELSAARGDARRVVDRLIGGMSSDAGAVGRVQGSLLIAMQHQLPIVGIATYSLESYDGRGDFVASVPVFAGQSVPTDLALEGRASVWRSDVAMLARQAMSHDDIILSASIATGENVYAVSRAMQSLYERGSLTYPRSKDHAISPEAVRRLQVIARSSGAGFEVNRFRAIRQAGGEHSHEAPNPLVFDVPINRSFEILPVEEKVLVHITRNLLECGIPCHYQTPRLFDLSNLPKEVSSLRWHRVIPIGERLWSQEPASAGYQQWSREQSLLHFMSRNDLGRPSTIVGHVEKFLSRGLVGNDLELTKKGREWSANVGHLFSYQNISKIIENYIDSTRKPPNEMVVDIMKICGLDEVGSSRLQGFENDDEEHEIYAWNVS